jgi:hypothetical protein
MLINFNHLKTFYKAIIQKMKSFRGNWNQNDPTADDYIKNRPFYSEGVKEQTVVLVDNLTSDVYSDYHPSCNFVPGQSYTVTYNGVTYSDLVCYRNESYNVICDEDNGYPCYIDDDGGNGLFIGANDDNWTISITTTIATEVIHKIDKKFIDLPNNIITEDDLAPVARSNDYWDLDNIPQIDSELSTTSRNAIRNSSVAQALQQKLSLAEFSLPSARYWQDVCYGNGKYIAIAGGSSGDQVYAVSKSGQSWQLGDLPSKQPWSSICYGNDKFVVVSGTVINSTKSTTAAYSYDGSNWTETQLPALGQWFRVCYGNGMYIAIDYGSNAIAYSYDGIVWQPHQISTTSYYTMGLADICYGDNKFVAVASYGVKNCIRYSYNGIEWFDAETPAVRNFASVCYGSGMFVAVGNENNTIFYSADGITWASTDLGKQYDLNSVCYGAGKFVALCGHLNSNNSYGKALYSTNGINWIECDIGVLSYWTRLCCGDSGFVAIAGGTHNSRRTVYSMDGICWTCNYLAQGELGRVTKEVAMDIQSYLNAVKTINGVAPSIDGNIEVEAMSMEKIDEICV